MKPQPLPPRPLFQRTRVHVSVGAIGHSGHGKTTLTAALTGRQAHRCGGKVLAYRDFAKHGTTPSFPGPRARIPPAPNDLAILTVALHPVEYQSVNRHYTHFDCPGHPRYVKNMLTAAAQLDAAILVVAANEGPMAQTREHLHLARMLGVSQVVVFLNKTDAYADPELLDLVEMDVRLALNLCGFPGDEVPIVRGSALRALESEGKDNDACRCLDELLETLETALALPPRDLDAPFRMTVDHVHSIRGRGTVATGRIESGRVRRGDPLEIVGLRSSPWHGRATVVSEIGLFNSKLEEALAGDHVGLLLRGIERSGVQRGHLLAVPKSLRTCTRFTARMQLLQGAEGGRPRPCRSGLKVQFYFRTADVPGIIQLPDGVEQARPGELVHLQVELDREWPIFLEQGQLFAIREGGRPLGGGMVTHVFQETAD